MIKENNIEIIHHSTSSFYEIIFTRQEEYEQGKERCIQEKIWLDYGEIENLKNILNKIKL